MNRMRRVGSEDSKKRLCCSGDSSENWVRRRNCLLACSLHWVAKPKAGTKAKYTNLHMDRSACDSRVARRFAGRASKRRGRLQKKKRDLLKQKKPNLPTSREAARRRPDIRSSY